MRNTLQFAGALIALIAAPALAQQASIPKSPIAQTELVLDAGDLAPGKAAYAGVHFTLPEGWHIYWQNPGDSGIPTTLEWTLPPGVTASDVHWPTPERVETSGIVNYGYSHEVTLSVPLVATQGAKGGPIGVKVTYLICRDVCIPETASLNGTLPASQKPELIAAALEKLPKIANFVAHYTADATHVTLTVSDPSLPTGVSAAQWFPIDDGVVQNAGDTALKQDGTSLTLTLPRGASEPVPTWRGVLQLTSPGGVVSYALAATRQESAGATPSAASPALATSAPTVPHSLLALLGLAFIGGLILNIMPCVLPILALKALAVAKKAHVSRAAAARQGFSYTAGVVLSFLVIAALMLALKASGAAIGWGFQLQNTSFVMALGVVMLAVAANLLGLFELPVLFGEKATGIDDHSLRGSFLTGALAVLVATPCSAPFMATAIGATLALTTTATLTVFTSLGLGMAAPFLLISLWPAARRLLPKPGAWMHRFKQLLAIPMLATAAWLFWVAASMHTPATANSAAHETYSAARLQQLRDAGTPVLLDATAAWCLTCKVNERVALHPDSMQQFFRAHQVVLMVADWTNSDPAITSLLAEFGRNGVPLYVYYPPHAEPKLLPQLLTPSIVRAAISGSENGT